MEQYPNLDLHFDCTPSTLEPWIPHGYQVNKPIISPFHDAFGGTTTMPIIGSVVDNQLIANTCVHQ